MTEVFFPAISTHKYHELCFDSSVLIVFSCSLPYSSTFFYSFISIQFILISYLMLFKHEDISSTTFVLKYKGDLPAKGKLRGLKGMNSAPVGIPRFYDTTMLSTMTWTWSLALQSCDQLFVDACPRGFKPCTACINKNTIFPSSPSTLTTT